jgi:hypothetical protein
MGERKQPTPLPDPAPIRPPSPPAPPLTMTAEQEAQDRLITGDEPITRETPMLDRAWAEIDALRSEVAVLRQDRDAALLRERKWQADFERRLAAIVTPAPTGEEGKSDA